MRPVASSLLCPAECCEGVSSVRCGWRNKQSGIWESRTVLCHACSHVHRTQTLKRHATRAIFILQTSHEVVQILLQTEPRQRHCISDFTLSHSIEFAIIKKTAYVYLQKMQTIYQQPAHNQKNAQISKSVACNINRSVILRLISNMLSLGPPLYLASGLKYSLLHLKHSNTHTHTHTHTHTQHNVTVMKFKLGWE